VVVLVVKQIMASYINQEDKYMVTWTCGTVFTFKIKKDGLDMQDSETSPPLVISAA
jgi:hypothetical protein